MYEVLCTTCTADFQCTIYRFDKFIIIACCVCIVIRGMVNSVERPKKDRYLVLREPTNITSFSYGIICQ